jgi:hypothetical protein
MFGDKTTYATGKAPRPILVNIWYPPKTAGKDKTMRHRDYLEIQSAEPRLAKFSAALADYVGPRRGDSGPSCSRIQSRP